MGARLLEGTQRQWVKQQLLDSRRLAHRDLIRICGGQGGHRLAAHIWNLRHREGWQVDSTVLPGAAGPNPMVRYSVPPGWRPNGAAQLGLPL